MDGPNGPVDTILAQRCKSTKSNFSLVEMEESFITPQIWRTTKLKTQINSIRDEWRGQRAV